MSEAAARITSTSAFGSAASKSAQAHRLSPSVPWPIEMGCSGAPLALRSEAAKLSLPPSGRLSVEVPVKRSGAAAEPSPASETALPPVVLTLM